MLIGAHVEVQSEHRKRAAVESGEPVELCSELVSAGHERRGRKRSARTPELAGSGDVTRPGRNQLFFSGELFVDDALERIERLSAFEGAAVHEESRSAGHADRVRRRDVRVDARFLLMVVDSTR